jgi:ribonucleotide reductase beta subunit family protein with ferritin-like domain
MIFEKGKIDGITDTQLKYFVQSRIDVCLEQLGIEKFYKPQYNPIATWFYKNISGDQFHDFFVKTGNAYNRNWDRRKFTW